jgi:hypothetical protein
MVTSLLQFGLGHRQVARPADVGDGVFVALDDVEGEVDVFLVGGDRHLGRVDTEFSR